MSLAGKVALITGAGSGIGRATALRLAADGAAVAVMGRRRDRIESTADEVRRQGGEALPLLGDVSAEGDAEESLAQTVAAFGGIDILFNNAGIAMDGNVLETSPAAWRETLEINLTGPFLMSRAAVPCLRRRGGGVIINNASTLGLVGLQRAAAYCASKGGLVLLTRAMALDHAADKIRVNAICPGVVDTAMPRRRGMDGADRRQLDEAYGALHPLGRIGTPEEVAALVAFLAGDDAAFITGVAYPVDGGLTAL
jgi:meso-butanediol dehydrogenase/(S,S)-butanediol dehydrogenase/diacetyl reductase